MDIDKFVVKIRKDVEIDTGYYNYNSISKSIPFMKLGLAMLNKTYTNLQVYEDIIQIHKMTNIPVISFHLDRQKIDSLVDTVEKFKKNKRRKYLVIYLGIFFDNGKGHATVLMIEKKKNRTTMERYDPDYLISNEQVLIDEYMNILSTNLGLEYIPASRACPYIGPQTMANDDFGYCQTYVLHYIRDRMMYVFSDQIQIVDNTFKRLANKRTFIKELDDTIKSIVRFIFKTYEPTYIMKDMILNYNSLTHEGKTNVVNYLSGLIK